MKRYLCKKLLMNIKVDGDLDKTEWNGVEGVSLVDTVTGEEPRQWTTAKITWNDDFLYVSFKCKDNFLNATFTGYNDKLYDEEVVEIFIDDDKDLKTYIEIEVNPLNAVLHYCIHNNLQGKILTFARTDKKILTAVKYDEKTEIWSTEIAIPFSELITGLNIPPRAGDKWRVNLYRIDRPGTGSDEYSAWSPTGKVDFHVPERFGELVFMD